MPRWIGEKYSKLWAEFKENTFYFEEAEEILGKITLNYLSELKKHQALFIFGRKSKKRIYRLVSPNIFVYALANEISLYWLKQGAYANLILTIFMCLKEAFSQDLTSFGVYGSIARNTAKRESDLDIFLIFREIPDDLNKRFQLLMKIEDNKLIQDERKFLDKKTYYPRISFYTLKESELEVNFFTIDMAFDIKVIYDLGMMGDFIKLLDKIIRDQGIRRKYLDKTRYYLDLNLNFGEVFEF